MGRFSEARIRGLALMLAALGMLVSAGTAQADDGWFPHPASARWQYLWSDSVYAPAGTVENVVVQQQLGPTFTLAWADPQDQPPPAGGGALLCPTGADVGMMSFQDTSAGPVNTDWDSCPPPSGMPVLCATTTSCANSLASALYTVIWGSRAPMLSEPLLLGTTWNATGGADNTVDSTSQYLGMQLVKVPAFPNGVRAAVVRTNIAQTGALGDPYGTGIRTTWWVYGVGPVRVLFQHTGGSGAPVTTASLLSTNLTAQPPPPDANYFPLQPGLKGTYKWTNSRYMRRPEVERVSVDSAVNRTATISVKSLSGLMRVKGRYQFSDGASGITNIWGTSSGRTLVRVPRLGHHRHLLTPIDLMVFGYGPVLPEYPRVGASWRSGNPHDRQTYGVTGTTRIVGMRTVHVPAGTFQALEVRSMLTQRGYPYGSGVRTSWFAAGRGLVKLVFQHRDGSTSLVQLVR